MEFHYLLVNEIRKTNSLVFTGIFSVETILLTELIKFYAHSYKRFKLEIVLEITKKSSLVSLTKAHSMPVAFVFQHP